MSLFFTILSDQDNFYYLCLSLFQPMIELAKEFMMCPHPLFLEASLDKEVCINNFIVYNYLF